MDWWELSELTVHPEIIASGGGDSSEAALSHPLECGNRCGKLRALAILFTHNSKNGCGSGKLGVADSLHLPDLPPYLRRANAIRGSGPIHKHALEALWLRRVLPTLGSTNCALRPIHPAKL